MMDKAQDPMSSTVSAILQEMSRLAVGEFLIDYDFGASMSFVQPEAWSQEQYETKGAAAVVVLVFMGVFMVFVVIFSVIGNWYPSDKDRKNSNKKYNPESQTLLSEDEMSDYSRGSIVSAPFKREITISTRPSQATDEIMGSRDETFHNYELGRINKSSTNYTTSQRETVLFSIDNSSIHINPKKQHPQLISRSKFSPSFWKNITGCFSIDSNIHSLSAPITKFKEDEDLRFLDGLRVLTMCWVVLSVASCFTLISNVRDMHLVFSYFSQVPYSTLGASFSTPDLFLFFIFFLGFIWM